MADYQSSYTGAQIDAGIAKANTAVQPSALETKQDTLVSGTNIKTVNGESVLGEGDIEVGSSNNGWNGKVVSILGDSISTFEGYNPVADGHNLTHRVRYNQDNAAWYFSEGGTVNDTYWLKLINELGAKLGINDSWAGSRISNSKATNSGDVGPDACMAGITRITNLGSNGTPDLIIYYGGTNDAGKAVTVGTFDSTATYTVDLSTNVWNDFATAYKDSIMRLQYYYPYAKILVLLPMYCATYYTMGAIDQYNEVIKEVCDYFGVEYIDLRRCGVNSANLSTMLGDGIHPKVAGFKEMYNYIKNKLMSMYSSNGQENVVYTVTNSLTSVVNADRYIKGVSAGKSYSATITGNYLSVVKVTMGGEDITSTAYNSTTGAISIASVTGNIVISEAYTPLQYITSTNGSATSPYHNSYIQTDIAWQDGDVWEVDAQSSDSSYTAVLIDRDERGGGWFGQNGGYWGVGGSGYQTTFASTTRATSTITFANSGVSASVTDGNTTETVSRVAEGSSSTGTGYYAIGAMAVTNTNPNRYGFKGNIYSAKCTRSGNVIGNFLPVKRVSDNKVGLLDTVTGVFKSSNTEYEFTAGPTAN